MEEYLNSVGTLALNGGIKEKEENNNSFHRSLNLVDGKVSVIEVQTETELEQFIQLPYSIYEDISAWPGQNDENVKAFFNPETNLYSKYMKLKPIIAIRDGQTVGRLCIVINDRFNEHWNLHVACFGFFECINDQEVTNLLFEKAEEVALSNGYNKLYGPFSPTYLEEIGILMDNYEKTPVAGMAFNPPYYLDLLQNFGFEKIYDVLHPSLDADEFCRNVEKKMEKLVPFIEDKNIIVRYFDWNNLERDAEIVRELFFQTFHDHWGYYPAESEEWCNILKSYKPDIYNELFLILEDAGEPIAFTLGLKDTNQDLIAEHDENHEIQKGVRWDLIGVKPDYHRNGLGTYIAYNILPGIKINGIQKVSVSWILEDNYKSIGLCKSIGMQFDTHYRLFEKKF